MANILSDLRKYGLVSTPQATEAFMPPDKDQQDAEDQSAAAKDDAAADGQDQGDEADQGDEDQQPGDDEGADVIEVPVEVKDKILHLHQLAGEIYGDLTGDDSIKDRYQPNHNEAKDGAHAHALSEEGDVDVGTVINELITTSWGGDNASQGKAVELLKGLAFSDDPRANAFMQKLDAFTSGLDANEFNPSAINANASFSEGKFSGREQSIERLLVGFGVEKKTAEYIAAGIVKDANQGVLDDARLSSRLADAVDHSKLKKVISAVKDEL